jgi:hypothetical protein
MMRGQTIELEVRRELDGRVVSVRPVAGAAGKIAP